MRNIEEFNQFQISNDVEDQKRTTASLFKLFTTTTKTTTTTTESTTTKLFNFTKKPKKTTTKLFSFTEPTTATTTERTTTTTVGTPREDWVMREKCRVASDNQGTIFKVRVTECLISTDL